MLKILKVLNVEGKNLRDLMNIGYQLILVAYAEIMVIWSFDLNFECIQKCITNFHTTKF